MTLVKIRIKIFSSIKISANAYKTKRLYTTYEYYLVELAIILDYVYSYHQIINVKYKNMIMI